MFDEQVNAIMHSIFLNAEKNIDNNCEYIGDENDSLDFCQQYLKEYASKISENIRDIEDKQELLEALQGDIIESAWIHNVMLAYRDEVQRHIELETNEDVQELIHQTDTTDSNDTTTPKKIKYTITKKEHD